MYLQITQGRPQIHNAQSFRREVMKAWCQLGLLLEKLWNFKPHIAMRIQKKIAIIFIDISLK